MLGEEQAYCVLRSFCNIFASQYFKDGLGKNIAIKRLHVGLVVSNRDVRVLPSFPLLGSIDLSVCTFSFMLWVSIYLGGRSFPFEKNVYTLLKRHYMAYSYVKRYTSELTMV